MTLVMEGMRSAFVEHAETLLPAKVRMAVEITCSNFNIIKRRLKHQTLWNVDSLPDLTTDAKWRRGAERRHGIGQHSGRVEVLRAYKIYIWTSRNCDNGCNPDSVEGRVKMIVSEARKRNTSRPPASGFKTITCCI